MMARFELLTREGCHLCDEMAQILDQEGLQYSLRDVDADDGDRKRWGEVVPVLLRDGQAVAKIRLRRRDLARLVARRR